MSRARECGDNTFRIRCSLVVLICKALIELILGTTKFCLSLLHLLINLLNAHRSRTPGSTSRWYGRACVRPRSMTRARECGNVSLRIRRSSAVFVCDALLEPLLSTTTFCLTVLLHVGIRLLKTLGRYIPD